MKPNSEPLYAQLEKLSDLSPDALMTRSQLSEKLLLIGIRHAPATLATKAVRGGGPPYRVFGSKPMYRWGDALLWATSRLSALCANTAEARVRQSGSAQPQLRRELKKN